MIYLLVIALVLLVLYLIGIFNTKENVFLWNQGLPDGFGCPATGASSGMVPVSDNGADGNWCSCPADWGSLSHPEQLVGDFESSGQQYLHTEDFFDISSVLPKAKAATDIFVGYDAYASAGGQWIIPDGKPGAGQSVLPEAGCFLDKTETAVTALLESALAVFGIAGVAGTGLISAVEAIPETITATSAGGFDFVAIAALAAKMAFSIEKLISWIKTAVKCIFNNDDNACLEAYPPKFSGGACSDGEVACKWDHTITFPGGQVDLGGTGLTCCKNGCDENNKGFSGCRCDGPWNGNEIQYGSWGSVPHTCAHGGRGNGWCDNNTSDDCNPGKLGQYYPSSWYNYPDGNIIPPGGTEDNLYANTQLVNGEREMVPRMQIDDNKVWLWT